MQPIHVCSRRQAMVFKPQVFDRSLCISIGSKGQEDGRLVGEIKGNFAKVLRLRFDDIVEGATMLQPFSPEDAKGILDAVRDLDASTPIMVHCEGGVSRSVAIGYFLSALLRRNIQLHAANDFSMGNRLVLAVLRRTYLINHLKLMKMPRFDILRLKFPQ